MIRRTNSSHSLSRPRAARRTASHHPHLQGSLRLRSPGAALLRDHGAAEGEDDVETRERTEADEKIYEEIAEIKRYEDFSTIDWVQDAAREQMRKRVQRQEQSSLFKRSGSSRWIRKLREAYDAAQGWILVTIIGAAIGLNAAILNIVTEWLSDIKLGYCKTAFYLNESFCCWGSEEGCDDWHRWSSLWPVNYVLYIVFSGVFAFLAARLVKAFAPYAAGSGISEIKCIIAGFVMKGFLGFWTLVIKSVALPITIASGLSVGKEGPSVHYAVCTGNVISRLFDRYKRNAAKTREILSATAAAGVAVAFGSPIGGVLFSLEEMSNYFPLKTLWRSYFCALVATAVLAAMNPFRTGQLVMFQVRYDRSWHFFEIVFFIILGAFGGLYGAFMIKWNLRAQAFRKKYLAKYPILEATLLALFTAVVCYPNMFLRIDMTESMEILFKECEGDADYNGLCESKNRWSLVLSLLLATVMRIFLVLISYGCKVPAGIFVPSMAIGASFGRAVGILVQALYEAHPNSPFFSACEPDVPCITPGTYAFLGAAAALSGIMHITVSVVVIMFELTGALTYILPTMIVVGITKAVGDRFAPGGGIADRMIRANGFPFLDSRDSDVAALGVPVSAAMTPRARVAALPASGLSLSDVERVLARAGAAFQGFPIVESAESDVLLGHIGRTELRFALSRAQRDSFVPSHARVVFAAAAASSRAGVGSGSASDPFSAPVRPASPSASASSPLPNTAQQHAHSAPSDVPVNALRIDTSTPSDSQSLPTLDLSRFADTTPLTVHPATALDTVQALFAKLGPRVLLVVAAGRLVGVATAKDVLRWRAAAAHGKGRARSGAANGGTAGAGSAADAASSAAPTHTPVATQADDGRLHDDGEVHDEEEQDELDAAREERLWQLISSAGSWTRGRVSGLTRGHVVLGEPGEEDAYVSGGQGILGAAAAGGGAGVSGGGTADIPLGEVVDSTRGAGAHEAIRRMSG